LDNYSSGSELLLVALGLGEGALFYGTQSMPFNDLYPKTNRIYYSYYWEIISDLKLLISFFFQILSFSRFA